MSRGVVGAIMVAAVVVSSAACSSETDAPDPPSGEAGSDSAVEETAADEESLALFLRKYLRALQRPDGSSADGLSCEGTSTMHGVVSAIEGGNWELGPVRMTGKGQGFAELRETVGDTALGLQAEFRDGQWCALR